MDLDGLSDRARNAEMVRRDNDARNAAYAERAAKAQEAHERRQASALTGYIAHTERARFDSASAKLIEEKVLAGDYNLLRQTEQWRADRAEAARKAIAKAQDALDHPQARDTRTSAQKIADAERERGFEDADTNNDD